MSKLAQSFLPLNYVSAIVNHKMIYLRNVSEQAINNIKELGASRGPTHKLTGLPDWIINCISEIDLAEKLEALNKLGFLFVDEPAGWPPAAVFEYLREKKLIEGKYKAVTWRGPGDWYVIER